MGCGVGERVLLESKEIPQPGDSRLPKKLRAKEKTTSNKHPILELISSILEVIRKIFTFVY